MRRHAWLLGFVGAAAIAMGWQTAALAAFPGGATVGGRAEYHGYFQDITDCSGHSVLGEWQTASPDASPAIPPSVNTAAELIAYVKSKMQAGQTNQNIVGARFIVETMIGDPLPHEYPPSAAQIADWEARLLYAESQGWINWNSPYTYNINSYWQGGANGSAECGGGNPNDDAFFSEPNVSEPNGVIVIHNPSTGQTYYALRRSCANPLGNMPGIPGLPAVNFSLSANLAGPSTAVPLVAGNTYTFNPGVSNAGPGASLASALTLPNPNTGLVSCNAISAPGACGANPWTWAEGPIGSGGTVTESVTVTISGNTPDGTTLCFQSRVTPKNAGGSFDLSGQLCYTVYRIHNPGIIGQSGDVHAGGGVCGGATTGGVVRSNAGAKSFGEYVVSATGLVSNFGSNNSAAGQGATLGKTGNYYPVCRPDLVNVALAYYNAGNPYTNLPAGTYDVNSLPPSATGIYILGGGNLTLHSPGGFNKKITIAATSPGSLVTIDHNIVLGASSVAGSQVPSLGIISAGDILISGATTRVDAYLFANGAINTCAEFATTPAACHNTIADPAGKQVGLLVNGFLMAHDLYFRRIGPVSAAATNTIGEEVNLTGQLYLNPPKFFDNAGVLNLLQNQGEKPPLN